MRRAKRGADGVVRTAETFTKLTTPALRATPPLRGGEYFLLHLHVRQSRFKRPRQPRDGQAQQKINSRSK